MEELLLAVNQGVGIVRGNLKPVAVGDGVTRAGLHAVPTKDAPVVINVVNLCVTLRRTDSILAGILGSFDVDAIGRASRRAKETGYAFFEPIFIALQNVQPAVAVFKMNGFVRVVSVTVGWNMVLKVTENPLARAEAESAISRSMFGIPCQKFSIADAP